MDKAMLLMMLAQQAPRLLSALSKNSGWTNNFELNGMGIVNDLASKQYDIPSMEDTLNSRNGDIDSLVRTLAKDSIGPTDIFYNPEFPSDGTEINPNSSYEDLQDMYLSATNNEGPDMPAMALATKMLMRNPEIGLSDTEVYRNNISLNDRINLQGAVYSDDHPDKSPFMTTNPEATIDALRGVVNGVNNSPRLAELMGTQQDLIGDDNLDEGLSNFYKRLQQRRLQK